MIATNSNEHNVTVPYSEESEEAVLGAIIVNPDAFIEVASFLTAEDFFLIRNAYIWRAMERLQKREETIDYITVIEEVKAMGFLEEIGGPAHISHLVNSAPSSVHTEVYGRFVERTSQRRKLITASDEIKRLAYNEDAPLEDILQMSEACLLKITGNRVKIRGNTLKTAMSNLYDVIEGQLKEKSRLLGISTGLSDLDALIDGWQKEKLYLIGARPGMGKSAFILFAALHAAKTGKRVAIFSTEMSEDENSRRLLAIESQVDGTKLKKPSRLDGREMSRMTAAFGQLSEYNIYIDDTPMIKPHYLETKIMWLNQAWGEVDVVFVDGIYRMAANEKMERNDLEVGSIAADLKTTARKLMIPVVATQQLNREVKKRTDKRPLLSDLKNSSGLEENADVVLFLYRDVYYNPTTEMPNAIEFINAKNRDGKGLRTILAHFEPSIYTFSDGRARSVILDADYDRRVKD